MGKTTNGGSKASLQSQTVSAMKARSLLTRGEKLIILRNALFDDDPGGYGAERDVTRWLAAPFRTYKKNGVDVDIEFAHGESLMGSDLGDLLDLAETFAEVEEDAGREYHKEDKEEHLTEEAARFLIARDNSAGGKIVGFAHYRFTLHGELADSMEGDPCVFVYDVHVSEPLQRKGLARHLMTMLELVGRKASMSEMVAPLPNTELALGGKQFFEKGLKGWALDGLTEVAPKTAKALAEDGSMNVFVKILKPREVEAEAEEEGDGEPTVAESEIAAAAFKGTAAAAASEGSGGGGSESAQGAAANAAGAGGPFEAPAAAANDDGDDWVVALPPPPGARTGSKQGKKGKNNKKKASLSNKPAAGAAAAETTEPQGGSTKKAPLSV
mmetsp:Transcript_5567/g.10445  ORF Transcript_5567/g.10445 Transcript_5567/m.10445 type:complete len:384 (+) Transcript_5567:29-1180(+)